MPRKPKIPDCNELSSFFAQILRDPEADLKTRLHVAELLLKRLDSDKTKNNSPPPLIVEVQYASHGGDSSEENKHTHS